MGNTVSNRTRNLLCYNDKCAAVFPVTKSTGCPFSDTCPDFMAVGFGSAKKKTNFDHIREDLNAEQFAEMFSRTGCPNHTNLHDCTIASKCKDCWLDWLNSEYHN